MDQALPTYRIFPLGDQAITIDFGNVIDEATNKMVLALFRQFSDHPFPGMIEAVPAYSSLTIHYDVFDVSKASGMHTTAFDLVSERVHERLDQPLPQTDSPARLMKIPVCYDEEFGPDLAQLASEKNISPGELIGIHSSKVYRVYMLGFLPGFSYMGEVDERISANRKAQPSMIVAGSVGIAGKQTGIYPFASPGGWQIIGRTPLKLFNAGKEQPSLLGAGDTVRFISISKDEFENY